LVEKKFRIDQLNRTIAAKFKGLDQDTKLKTQEHQEQLKAQEKLRKEEVEQFLDAKFKAQEQLRKDQVHRHRRRLTI